jgi:hypothetical protein
MSRLRLDGKSCRAHSRPRPPAWPLCLVAAATAEQKVTGSLAPGGARMSRLRLDGKSCRAHSRPRQPAWPLCLVAAATAEQKVTGSLAPGGASLLCSEQGRTRLRTYGVGGTHPCGIGWRYRMRRRRAHSAIGATLIGLGFLLTASDSGVSQDVIRSGLSADKPLNYHLSALSSNSFFSRHGGIWVRHEGMWAFRPTLRFDWQVYFRCQAGYGCGGLGWAPYRYGTWLPFGFAGWDLAPGGWMWFPGQRLSGARAWDLYWDLWFFSPSHMFGRYGSGPQLRAGFAPIVWDAGRAARSVDHRPGQDRDPWKAPADASAVDRTRLLVHPLLAVPVVTVSVNGADPEPSGLEVPQRPSIDRATPARPIETLSEPSSIQRGRQKSPGRPEIDRLEALRDGNRLRRGADLSRPPAELRSNSPRVFERTNPRVFGNRVTTGNDRTPSARSRPGASRPDSRDLSSAQPRSSGQSKSAGKTRMRPEQ